MGSVHNLVTKHQAPSLIQELMNGLIEGFNRLVDTGKVDKNAANLMVGYLSAAVIALRVTGNAGHAEMFYSTASRIHADWRSFEHEVRTLVAALQGEQSNPL